MGVRRKPRYKSAEREKQRGVIARLAALVLCLLLGLLLGLVHLVGSISGQSPPATGTTTPAVASVALSNSSSSSQTTKVEVVPASLELLPKGAAQAILVVRNTSANPLNGLKIVALSDANVKVESEPPLEQTQNIVAKGEFAWTLSISNKGEESTTGTIIIRIAYTLAQAGSQLPQVAYALLQVRSRDIAEVAEVKVETTLETLDQQHPGKVYLVIVNKSDQSIILKETPIWDAPSFIRIDAREFEKAKMSQDIKAFTFSPHQTGVVPFDVTTLGRVQPGKHLLVATVKLEWGRPDSSQTRNIVVTKSIDVGVFGESVVLKVLAVPSFLFIPGFIAVVIWGLLWKWGLFKSRQDAWQSLLEFSEDPTKPQFWVAAITISIVVAWIYMELFNRDFPGTYGLVDLVFLWLFSVVVLGFGGYAAIVGSRRVYLIRRTPSDTDSPIAILKKLDRQGLGVIRETAMVTMPGDSAGGTKYSAFLLQKKQDDRPTTWVGPAIQVMWRAGADQGLKTAVDTERKPGGNAWKMSEHLAKAQAQPGSTVVVKWKTPGPESNEIKGIYEVKTASMTLGDEVSIVEVEIA